MVFSRVFTPLVLEIAAHAREFVVSHAHPEPERQQESEGDESDDPPHGNEPAAMRPLA